MNDTATSGQAPVRFKGIGVSPGVVIGPAFVIASDQTRVVERHVPEEAIDHEICRLEDALIETRRQIKAIQKDLESRTEMGDASILDAHLMVLDDRAFIEEVVNEIRKKNRNAESIVKEASDRYAAILGSVEDDYLRERVADIRDVARRIIRNLSGRAETSVSDLEDKSIIIGEDIPPSLTASFRGDTVLGLATDLGSATSHTAVMARAMEIPAVVGLRDLTSRVSSGDMIVMDGARGVIIVHPSQSDLDEYGKLAEARRMIQQGLTSLQHEPAETRDGHRIVLSANAEGPEELDAIVEYGAEGIGLFRSEYLYISRNANMGEDDQAEIYGQIAERLAPAPVIIRTLDIGGDKFLSGGRFRKETNPFLGCRSIRLSLLYPDHFKRQLRAILRASAKGNVRVMYPMISNAREVIQANALLDEAKEELIRKGVPFDKDIEVGVMIETPAAALTAEVIARNVSFFSLGTNDLVQYTLAVDRVNERVAYLYEPTHPAVLKLLKITIDAGHAAGIWVGVCGEMAADPLMTPLLLGMGVDEMSVAPAAVPVVKDLIRNIDKSRAETLACKALDCRSATEVLSLCRELTAEVAPELLELI